MRHSFSLASDFQRPAHSALDYQVAALQEIQLQAQRDLDRAKKTFRDANAALAELAFPFLRLRFGQRVLLRDRVAEGGYLRATLRGAWFRPDSDRRTSVPRVRLYLDDVGRTVEADADDIVRLDSPRAQEFLNRHFGSGSRHARAREHA